MNLARKHRMPRTPLQFLALSLFACGLIAVLCLWNGVRHDLRAIDTLRLQPVPDVRLISRHNKHLVLVPFAVFIILGGVYGAGVTFWKREQKLKGND